jgi:hypothetical protein
VKTFCITPAAASCSSVISQGSRPQSRTPRARPDQWPCPGGIIDYRSSDWRNSLARPFWRRMLSTNNWMSPSITAAVMRDATTWIAGGNTVGDRVEYPVAARHAGRTTRPPPRVTGWLRFSDPTTSNVSQPALLALFVRLDRRGYRATSIAMPRRRSAQARSVVIAVAPAMAAEARQARSPSDRPDEREACRSRPARNACDWSNATTSRSSSAKLSAMTSSGTARSCNFATTSDRFIAEMRALGRTAWIASAPGSPSINASNADASSI